MPAQKRLWCDDQAVASPRREQASERRKQGTIGGPEHRTSLLTSEHDELMSQHEQLDIFRELTAPAPDQQPEHNREGEIGERNVHPPILPSATTEEQRAATEEPRQTAGTRLRSPARFGYSRAREQLKRRRYPPELNRRRYPPSRTHRTGILQPLRVVSWPAVTEPSLAVKSIEVAKVALPFVSF